MTGPRASNRRSRLQPAAAMKGGPSPWTMGVPCGSGLRPRCDAALTCNAGVVCEAPSRPEAAPTASLRDSCGGGCGFGRCRLYAAGGLALPLIPGVAASRAASACCVAAVGSTTPGTAGRRTATATSRPTATTTSACGCPERLPSVAGKPSRGTRPRSEVPPAGANRQGTGAPVGPDPNARRWPAPRSGIAVGRVERGETHRLR